VAFENPPIAELVFSDFYIFTIAYVKVAASSRPVVIQDNSASM
jgi:hypothetical protein